MHSSICLLHCCNVSQQYSCMENQNFPFFSVLQENGYQLLFLSARAISQAYHTRQFLFNLKQVMHTEIEA